MRSQSLGTAAIKYEIGTIVSPWIFRIHDKAFPFFTIWNESFKAQDYCDFWNKANLKAAIAFNLQMHTRDTSSVFASQCIQISVLRSVFYMNIFYMNYALLNNAHMKIIEPLVDQRVLTTS